MDNVKNNLKELLDDIYKLAQLYYKTKKITVTDLVSINELNLNVLYEFNKALKLYLKDQNSKDNKEELFNYIKNYYINYYLPAWKNRNCSNYEKLAWEVNEAIYISLVKILF